MRKHRESIVSFSDTIELCTRIRASTPHPPQIRQIRRFEGIREHREASHFCEAGLTRKIVVAIPGQRGLRYVYFSLIPPSDPSWLRNLFSIDTNPCSVVSVSYLILSL